VVKTHCAQPQSTSIKEHRENIPRLPTLATSIMALAMDPGSRSQAQGQQSADRSPHTVFIFISESPPVGQVVCTLPDEISSKLLSALPPGVQALVDGDMDDAHVVVVVSEICSMTIGSGVCSDTVANPSNTPNIKHGKFDILNLHFRCTHSVVFGRLFAFIPI